jgi:predicted ribosome quality control (RQC) complex YloA/Tae2 family protein
MPTIDEMTLEEIEATMSRLRDRKRALRKTGKAAERRIMTLAKRRERFMDRVREIDQQIEELRREAALETPPAPKRRGRRPKSAQVPTE